MDDRDTLELRRLVHRLDRILSAYTDDLPFSIDLVGAVRVSMLRPKSRGKADIARRAVDHATGFINIQDARLRLDNTGVLR